MTRRKIIWLIAGGLAALTVSVASLVTLPSGVLFFLRRRLPRRIDEPSSDFPVGRVSDFAIGVSTRFVQSHRIYVVCNIERLYVLYARCTHQGCTPNWVAHENKFKCPCHESRFCMGSAFDGNGVNCEGPAPRPLDRVHVEVDSEGTVIADLSKLYQWPFDEPGASISFNQN